MNKFKFWIGINLCFLTTAVYGQDQYSYDGFDAPVSVTQYGGHYYLSCAGKNFGTSVKDGDGYVSRIRSDGSQEDAVKFIAGLNNPRGILAVQGTLYACDIDRLVGFDLKSKKKVFELSFAGEKTIQLTDIVSNNDKILYVSATDINTIFEVDLSAKKYKKYAEPIAPSGMLIDKNLMYVCSWGTDSLPNGKLGVIDMTSRKYTQLSDYEGFLWGLALNGNQLYFSDWVQFGKRGIINRFDLKTKEVRHIKFTSKMGGPAGFVYDARNNIFIVPAVSEGKVYGAMGFK